MFSIDIQNPRIKKMLSEDEQNQIINMPAYAGYVLNWDGILIILDTSNQEELQKAKEILKNLGFEKKSEESYIKHIEVSKSGCY